MGTIDPCTSTLLLIDFQARLMPAIEGGANSVANARILLGAAGILTVPVLVTEQNARKLGATVPELALSAQQAVSHKMEFDACRSSGFVDKLSGRPDVVIAGCEAHVCVLQTALSLKEAGRNVYVVRDAIASRRAESKETAIRRMERHGIEILTTEMVVFEWLGTSEHPSFREAIALLK